MPKKNHPPLPPVDMLTFVDPAAYIRAHGRDALTKLMLDSAPALSAYAGKQPRLKPAAPARRKKRA